LLALWYNTSATNQNIPPPQKKNKKRNLKTRDKRQKEEEKHANNYYYHYSFFFGLPTPPTPICFFWGSFLSQTMSIMMLSQSNQQGFFFHFCR